VLVVSGMMFLKVEVPVTDSDVIEVVAKVDTPLTNKVE